MTKGERMKEIAKASPDFGKRVGYKMCVVDEFHDMKELLEEIAELKAQIEKLIDFVLLKIECCDVCPITDTCINSEGTCPYAGILAKGEEEVTREWIMQFISRR